MLCAGNFYFLIAFSFRVTCYVLAIRYSASSRTETDLTFPDGSLFFFLFPGRLTSASSFTGCAYSISSSP